MCGFCYSGVCFFFSSRRRHTISFGDWSSDVCSSDLIEVQFDLICPWCLIGKRHLTSALQQFRRLRPDVPVDIVWAPVELLPGTPLEGLPYQAFYERRLGGAARSEEHT